MKPIPKSPNPLVFCCKSFILSLILIGLVSCHEQNSSPHAAYVPSAELLIKDMKRAWEGGWPTFVTFEQTVKYFKSDSIVRQEIWKEIMANPGLLHIRMNDFESGNGALFVNDSLFIFQQGELIRSEPRIHELLLLLGDIYFLELEEILWKLERLGVDISLRVSATYQDRKVWIIGANDPRSTHLPQFWIDKEYNWVVRTIMKENDQINRVDVKEYKIIDGYPIATDLHFFRNDQLYFTESYFNISFPTAVDSSVFNPFNFSKARW